MTALWREVYARVFADLLLRYGGSIEYITHLAQDAAYAAERGSYPQFTQRRKRR